ncbi:pur operon repressor [Clostridium sp. NSJ-49]|uniref:pur operon repressor n=1 Tax=Clostridium TaxID=1485 RepID=UPI00164B5B64|nr:pur operon repressor [Clostridium sp. NSJ-49]MBC5624198.1 pur operon repressor [Clostridium sp. NSJ-49]
MEKLSRNNRVVAITKILTETPNKVVGLNKFSELLNAAKSTISEDIVIVRELLEKLEMGKIETISGAAGGIKFIPDMGSASKLEFCNELCDLLTEEGRIVPGNFVYLTDIMYNPQIISKAGVILASYFKDMNIDYIVTVETKGIPLAYEVAKCLGIELVIIRRDNKITEGPTVTINYVSGTSGRIQQMSLAKKSMKPSSKCVFIDDFLRGGGTAQGIKDLLKEFDSELVGTGVLVDNIGIKNKRASEYIALIELEFDENTEELHVRPSEFIK